MNKKTADVSMVLLTGPSGAGKSVLAGLLERRSWGRVDGDALAKSLYVPGSPLLRKLGKVFGSKVLRSDGFLDASVLGSVVFPDAGKRVVLNGIVARPFLRLLRARLAQARGLGGNWVVEVAVYFDLGAPDLGVPVALVQAPLKVRVTRLLAMGLDGVRAAARARALHFGATERNRCDLVLDGGRTPAELLRDFERGWKTLNGSASRSNRMRP
ncbi:MAG: dephospho-CoA kinase [bacterium]